MSDVTQILAQIQKGDPAAADELLPLVYQELRRLAAFKLAQERPGQTLQATALVHEAYLRLIGPGESDWSGRSHFFSAAAEAMRRILVERARNRMTTKRGGDWRRVDLDPKLLSDTTDERLLALDEALEKLAKKDPVKADLVKLRYFVGCSLPEAALALGIGKSTADKYWAYAKSWIRSEMTKEP